MWMQENEVLLIFNLLCNEVSLHYLTLRTSVTLHATLPNYTPICVRPWRTHATMHNSLHSPATHPVATTSTSQNACAVYSHECIHRQAAARTAIVRAECLPKDLRSLRGAQKPLYV